MDAGIIIHEQEVLSVRIVFIRVKSCLIADYMMGVDIMKFNKIIRRQISVISVLTMLVVLSGCGTVSGSTSRRSVPGIPAPVQEAATGGTSMQVDGYDVKIDYKYSYDISALVVGAKAYGDYDIGGKLAPKDLALAWGTVAEYNDRINFHWSQSNRWYYWQTDTYDEIAPVGGVDGVNTQSANNHLVPADDTIRDAVKKIDAGDYVRIKGYLVNISASKPDGTNFWWNSSESRTDTGDGSCEVIYVTSIEKLN